MEQDLKTLWFERCAKGEFSPAVQGKGFISVMGKSGDEPFFFPRVSSLAVLDQPGELASDEVWAVREAERIFNAKRQENGRTRQVFGRNGSDIGEPMKTFSPEYEHIIVTNIITGG